jgi:hypothetical protein
MSILDSLNVDYARFPLDQTYTIYAQDVYFKDPMVEFRGIERYKQMVGFIQRWFLDCRMDVHGIQQPDQYHIKTEWTLSWNTPLPWKPRISISGWSELTLNSDQLIVSHIDYWHCSKWNVLKQHFAIATSGSNNEHP